MAGYWQDAAASAQALRDGWLCTGDIGRLDDDGFLTLLDRSKDLLVSGGSNIYPREVEELLLTHPAVAEVSLIHVIVIFFITCYAYANKLFVCSVCNLIVMVP